MVRRVGGVRTDDSRFALKAAIRFERIDGDTARECARDELEMEQAKKSARAPKSPQPPG